MSRPDPIGLAVLGIGDHARRNMLPAIEQCAAVRLVGIYTRDSARRTEQAAIFGAKAYASFTALLKDPEVQVLYICLPNSLHADACELALLAGKHVWCEKSLTSSEASWSRVLDLARSRDLALAECFMYPHHPQFMRIGEILASGELGHVRSLTARFGFPHLNSDNIRYSSQLGGGALLDVGCYAVSAARLLLGVEPRSIRAIVENETGFEVDTSGAALLSYEGGRFAHLEWGFGRAYRNELEIWGAQATLIASRPFSKPATYVSEIDLRGMDGTARRESIPASNHFVAMIQHLAQTVRDRSARERAWKEAEAQGRLLFGISRAATFGS